MFVSEYLLLMTALLQGCLLVFWPSRKIITASHLIFSFGLLVAALVLALGWGNDTVHVWGRIWEDQPLFRLPRAALLLSCVVLGRIVASTKELPELRKPEVLFLITVLSLLCDGLVLSENLTLTLLLLMMVSWTGVFLGGLAYRGRLEGEAILKFWLQVSLALVVGAATLVVLTLVAGGVHYDMIAAAARGLEQYSLSSLFLVLALFLPFVLASGIFPFHFAVIDRDHGVPWAVQAIFGVLVQGSLVLSLWKLGLYIFGHAHGMNVSDGMRTLQWIGLAGGFVLVFFTLSQGNSKRLFAAFMGAQWSAVLAAGAMPSLSSSAAISYALSAIFLWGSLLAFVWSRMQEFAGGDQVSAVFGLGKKFRASGLILLVALCSPLCVPGFPGFPAAMHLLGAVIDQKVLSLLFSEVLLIGLLCFVTAKLAIDLLFREPEIDLSSRKELNLARYSNWDWAALGVVTVVMIVLGVLWSPMMLRLTDSAKLFLN